MQNGRPQVRRAKGLYHISIVVSRCGTLSASNHSGKP